MKRPHTYSDVTKLHHTVDWDNTFMFRVRGNNPYTGRDVWVTNCWQRTIADAELIMSHQHRWTNLRIIKKSVGEYMKEQQNIPRFC